MGGVQCDVVKPGCLRLIIPSHPIACPGCVIRECINMMMVVADTIDLRIADRIGMRIIKEMIVSRLLLRLPITGKRAGCIIF